MKPWKHARMIQPPDSVAYDVNGDAMTSWVVNGTENTSDRGAQMTRER